jgi:hypothetical protein
MEDTSALETAVEREPARGAADGPPVPLLVGAIAAVVLSAALLLERGIVVDVVGYLLASVVAISLVGLFHRTDLIRRQQPLYVARGVLTRHAGLVVALGLVVSSLHTWSIATELAR